MKEYRLKNKKDDVLNLGTRNGFMLNFTAGETKVISESVFNDFSDEIERAVEHGFLEAEKQTKKDTKKDKKETPRYDLNHDGKFDYKDKSIAGKALQKRTKSSKKTTMRKRK